MKLWSSPCVRRLTFVCLAAFSLTWLAVRHGRGDNPPALPVVSFAQSSYTVGESEGSVTITVTLSPSWSKTVTVQYATVDGTAVSPGDYGSTSGTLTFSPGQTSKTFTVSIVNDTLAEATETFQAKLSNPVNAVLGTTPTTVSIIDDDGTPPTVQFSSATYSAQENAGSATITVTLSGSFGKPVTVDYATSDGLAMSPEDYSAVSGMLSFKPGETSKTFSVPIVNDAIPEIDETVNLTLSNPSNATLGSPSAATLTIVDNDGVPPTCSSVVVTATGGNFSPDPAPIGTWVEASLSAQAVRPTPTSGYKLSSPSWTWKLDKAEYSDDQSTWNDAGGSGYSYMIASAPTSPPDGTYDYSAVTLSASFSSGAYWQISVDADVRYTDTSGACFEGGAIAQGTGTEFEVSILRKRDGAADYVPVQGNDKYALPGSFIDLKADVKPAGAKVTFKWDMPPAKAFKSYTMDNTQAKLEALPAAALDAQTLQFYWADSGDKTVKCTVAGGGETSKAASATVTVDKLTVDPAYKATQGSVGWNSDKSEFGLYGAGDKDGMEFTATVKIPEGYYAGKWQFVQTVVAGNFVTDVDGIKWHLECNGTTVLDGAVPYPHDGTDADGPAGPYDTGVPGGAVDTPGSPIKGTIKRSSDDKFKMYIMFKPSGAKANWVPVQYVDWSWKGTATLADGNWSLDGTGQSVSPAVSSSDHPTWSQNAQSAKYVKD